MGDIVKITKDIGGSICESLDFDLVDVEFVHETGHHFLRVYIDKKGGIRIDDCQKVSDLLSEKLDEMDAVSVPYYLEVSSPGLDRPLKTDNDYERNVGKEVEVNLYRPLEDRKVITGVLDSYDSDNLYVLMESDEKIEIPRELISLVKLVIKF